MRDNNSSLEIPCDSPREVHSIKVIPLEAEKKVMILKPHHEAVFHGDCTLVCLEGEAKIINPSPQKMKLVDDTDNHINKPRKYYVEGIIFGMRTDEEGLKFSIKRPQKWK